MFCAEGINPLVMAKETIVKHMLGNGVGLHALLSIEHCVSVYVWVYRTTTNVYIYTHPHMHAHAHKHIHIYISAVP